MKRNVLETVMGIVVLAVAGFFLVFAWHNADLRKVEGYAITAHFQGISGLPVGGDVRINGVRVGSVQRQSLDPQTFAAVVDMSISPEVQLPEDTVATVASEGLMGGAYVKLEPGRSKTSLPPGGRIAETRSMRSLEEMVGEVIFLATSDGTSVPAP